MSSRIKITLPEEVAARLDEMAAASGEPVARVAGQMVRDALTKITAAARANGTTPLDELPVARAPWLEPYGGDREWRQLTWGAIIALYGRYPEHLKGLKLGWWEDDSTVELLCAFAHWRQMLDDGATDPRQELDFQFSLIEFGRRLKEVGGGVAKEWQPGAAPGRVALTPVKGRAGTEGHARVACGGCAGV
jgi:hypothetical protein